MPSHAAVTQRKTPSFCKTSSPDFDAARCKRFRSSRADQEATIVQSILFDKSKFTATTARAWLKRNGFKSGKIDETPNELRFRQRVPGAFTTFRRKKLTAGVSAVVAK